MRKSQLAVLAATVMAALMAPAAADADARPSATGAGHFTPTTPADSEYRTFSFNAKQHADGSVTGQVQLHVRRGQVDDIVVHAELDCLRVVGNRASMSGVVTRSTGTPLAPEGRPVNFSVVDNGEGRDDPPDLVSNFFLTPPSPFQGCNAALTPPPTNAVENGNVQVRP